ncbi:MAG: apolipoprotein N-acyltransferase [Gemmatimonas sp.]
MAAEGRTRLSISLRLAALRGWRRALVAAVLGALLTLAMPPLFIVPAAFVSFAGLLWLLDGAAAARHPIRAAFLIAWWFGLGHFVTGIYWIANALLVDAAQFGWLIPFAVGGLSAYFAIYPALAGAAYVAAPGDRAAKILVFAAAWTVAEYLRGTLLTGFSWNLLASVWTFAPAAMQSAAWLGAYGLGLASALLFAAPAAVARRIGGTMRPVRAAALLAIIGASPVLIGTLRLIGAPAAGADVVPDVKFALVQANIPQQLKWRPEQRAEIVNAYLQLTATAASAGATHVVWPETAVPVAIGESEELRQAIATVLQATGAKALIAGTIRFSPRGETPERIWNSVEAVAPDGRVVSVYDKFHLVPFGEYVPLRSVLPIDKITPGAMDFSAGPGPRTISVPGLPPVGPLVCYEAIFPGDVAAHEPRPGLLLNVTNDAWFGDSSGPRQHLAAARMRAVEEGLPLVRAAGTGISAIVDPYGRFLARLDLGRRGVVDGPLPAALPPTVFARYGNVIALVLAALAAVAGMWHGRRR